MWCLKEVKSSFKLWFSDGEAINATRFEIGVSYRLIVDQLGFLDLVEIPGQLLNGVIANDELLSVPLDDADTDGLMNLSLCVDETSGYVLTYMDSAVKTGPNTRSPEPISVSGKFKPLPSVSAADAAFLDTMIKGKYVPYPKIPDAPGKTIEELKQLGQKLFPFTPYSFQLAVCVYDWTTASFTRMVFMKIFEYTGIPPQPFPIDQDSIAAQIWASNWGTYNPQDEAYMNSFMMKPSHSKDDVKAQLRSVAADLHKLSHVQNELLSVALQALPRTSIFQHSQLFSGQVDIYQLGLSHFGIEFLQCPLNDGPVGKELVTAFDDVLASYVSTGETITTKMAWSFTDTVDDGMHYSNGILLVANMPGNSSVWDHVAYVTPLSDDPKKTEYTFPPGTNFEVQSTTKATIRGKSTVVITLKPLPSKKQQTGVLSSNREYTMANISALSPNESNDYLKKASPRMLDGNQVVKAINSSTAAPSLPHTLHKTGGRRCACEEGTW